MAFHLVFLPTILLLLPCAVDLSNVIELDEKTSSAVYFTPGSSVKIGWVYKFSEDEQEFGEFFCGYRNNDGRVFPLAIDVDGSSFLVAYVRGVVNSDKPTDDRDLLRRTTDPVATNDAKFRRRSLALTSLSNKDIGEYFCGLHLTKPRFNIQYGGVVTLKLSLKENGMSHAVIAVVVTVPLVIVLLGLVIILVFWKKYKQPKSYSLADDPSVTSSDDEDVEFEKKKLMQE